MLEYDVINDGPKHWKESYLSYSVSIYEVHFFYSAKVPSELLILGMKLEAALSAVAWAHTMRPQPRSFPFYHICTVIISTIEHLGHGTWLVSSLFIYLFFGVKMADLIADYITWYLTKLNNGNSLGELFRNISRNYFYRYRPIYSPMLVTYSRFNAWAFTG
jgi:hypothetical protein